VYGCRTGRLWLTLQGNFSREWNYLTHDFETGIPYGVQCEIFTDLQESEVYFYLESSAV